MSEKADIESREDIELLLRSFYERALNDGLIGFIFTEVAKIDLESHIPHLCDFWENILLKPNKYKRNVLKKHLDLNLKTELKAEHFERWLKMFSETIDGLFIGINAVRAKNKAESIATVIRVKIEKIG